MLPNIREHSLRVTRVAVFLGEALATAGFPLHLPLIEAGALLHDLGKTPCLGTGQNHAEWGAAVLAELGYHEVARIVKEHVYLASDPASPQPPRETEVVNYADKRVLHTRVVTLGERFTDIMERYGRTPEAQARLAALEIKVQVLEDKLFAPLDLMPEDLLKLNHWREQ
ncbi:MAG: HD domain-containing protein [Deltaproteobacteria bacterium]|nr:HD domain-containing protein [Deltaproteobacteria bacterium]